MKFMAVMIMQAALNAKALDHYVPFEHSF